MTRMQACRRIAVFTLLSLCLTAVTSFAQSTVYAPYKKKTLIAHRGASGYAPEHTLEAYRLALAQGADFVEPDLQITKDGILICLHDLTLERTTNVAQVFPDRATLEGQEKHWYASDFTLAEVRRLDAGSWFDPKFKGAKVPTFQEMIDLVRGRAGLYPETKAPEVYGSRGFDMEKLLLAELKKNHLDEPGADKKTPIIIQSFSPASLRKMAVELKTRLPLVLLVDNEMKDEWLSAEGMKKAKQFAIGIGPAKNLVDGRPELVKLAHDAGLSVTIYTVRSKIPGRFRTAREEMDYFLNILGVDAVFTDNPDQFPGGKSAAVK
ncbi:MAG TPA: glycerophosphodiester phosphodiesterase family protein [Blastocatellia bacterium]|nr:glycerophosphodiester phosphodiesterase family protein [Blastocatellia bacterium]